MNNALREKAVCTGQVLSQVKYRQICNWGLPGNHQTDQIMTVLWEWSFKGTPILFCPCSGCWAAGLHHNCRLLLFKATMELGWMGLGQVEMPQSSLFLTIFSHFSWINSPQSVASLWLISWVLKIFTSVFSAFMEEKNFGVPYSTIFTDVTLSS